ncbi:MAG: cysteine synthase family protein [Elusimicrobiota bacterium]|nr:MAG: cysteine synthase family protein [Elusimicrobiota bacterium]
MPTAAKSRFDGIKVGNTPLLDVSYAFPELGDQVKVVAKAEWANPGGSVKDRAGYFIIKDALETGKLANGKILLDSSSGNTGIAYAWLGARLGVKVALAVPGSISKHRRAILQAYGVELLFTDPLEGSDGAIREVRLMLKAEPERYWYADQYSNPMTWTAHYETTGPEIFEQTGGKVTHFVAGLGTSGTFVGAGRRLRELNKNIRLVSMEPDGPMHGLEGLKHMETSIIPKIYDDSVADSRIQISTEEAQEAAKVLGRKGGILLGPSGGANLAAAVRLGRDLAKQGREAVVATVFCDSGERYLGERFWEP